MTLRNNPPDFSSKSDEFIDRVVAKLDPLINMLKELRDMAMPGEEVVEHPAWIDVVEQIERDSDYDLWSGSSMRGVIVFWLDMPIPEFLGMCESDECNPPGAREQWRNDLQHGQGYITCLSQYDEFKDLGPTADDLSDATDKCRLGWNSLWTQEGQVHSNLFDHYQSISIEQLVWIRNGAIRERVKRRQANGGRPFSDSIKEMIIRLSPLSGTPTKITTIG